MARGSCIYPRSFINRKDIEPPFKTDSISDQHKRRIKSENETYFHFWSIDKIRKCFGISDKNIALFFNEVEYCEWWDAWDHKGMGIYDKYHFYLDYITNLGGAYYRSKIRSIL